MQSVPITTDVGSSNLDQGEVYNIMWQSLSMTCDRSVVFTSSSSFLHQWNWPPRYNWNIVESGIEHHQTNISVGRIKCVPLPPPPPPPPPSIKPSLNLVSYQWQLYQFVCLKCWKSVWTPFRSNLWLAKVMSTVISTKTQHWLGKQGNTWPEMKLHYKVPLLGLSHKNFKIWYA